MFSKWTGRNGLKIIKQGRYKVIKQSYDEGMSPAEAAVFMCGGGHDIDSVDRLRRDR